MKITRALFSVYQKVAPPSREEVLSMIQKKIKLRTGELRHGWMVKAAAWVKKRHIDRGDKKVGLLVGARKQPDVPGQGAPSTRGHWGTSNRFQTLMVRTVHTFTANNVLILHGINTV